jgi:hypothetical protein
MDIDTSHPQTTRRHDRDGRAAPVRQIEPRNGRMSHERPPVFEFAVALLKNAARDLESSDPMRRKGAVDWIFDDGGGVPSVKWACGLVGLRVERFRRWAREVLEEHYADHGHAG